MSVGQSAKVSSQALPKAYQLVCERLSADGIRLEVTRKRVKNINFRLKPNLLVVSAPKSISDAHIAAALTRRLNWVLTQHPKVLIGYQNSQQIQQGNQQQTSSSMDPQIVKLWGKPVDELLTESQRLKLYRQALGEVMPALFAKWQPIVGQSASEQRIKKMSTRWGSCNVRARRIWLSVYLPAYPLECTEYVIVHELCHLHHANHGAKFWSEVKSAMPDYKRWHDMLAGKRSMLKPSDID